MSSRELSASKSIIKLFHALLLLLGTTSILSAFKNFQATDMADQEMATVSRKRVSSVGEMDYLKKTKHSVVGELVEKSRIDINAQPYFILKLLVDNKKKEYFTTVRIHNDIEINQTYEMTYINEKRSLKVIDFNKIEAKNTHDVTQAVLSDSDFEEENIVSINVSNFDMMTLIKNQRKCVMITKVDMKRGTGYQQIEATYTISSIVRAFRKVVQFGDDETEQMKEEKLLHYFNCKSDNSFELYRMKCKATLYNGGHEVYRTIEFTEGSYAKEVEFKPVKRCSSNLSRGAGNVIDRIELPSELSVTEDKNRFTVKTKTDSYVWYFNNVAEKELDLIKIRFNQLEDYAQSHKITVYVINNMKNDQMTILAIRLFGEDDLFFITPTM